MATSTQYLLQSYTFKLKLNLFIAHYSKSIRSGKKSKEKHCIDTTYLLKTLLFAILPLLTFKTLTYTTSNLS